MRRRHSLAFIEGMLRYAEDALTVHEPSASSKTRTTLEKAGGTRILLQLRGRFALRDADHFGCVLALINSRCVAEMMPDVRWNRRIDGIK